MLYQVAWTSSPLRNVRYVAGDQSNPAAQLRDCSGCNCWPAVLTNWRQPATFGDLAPPLNDIPAGVELQAKPAANSFAEPEPATGCPPTHGMVMRLLLEKMAAGNPKPFHAELESNEFSPKFGARNEVPHPPLNVRSSTGDQLKPIFELLVPPKSLYWSWRQDA